MPGSELPKSKISSQYSDPIKNESLKNLAHRLQRLDSTTIAISKALFEGFLSGRLNRDDPEAQAVALQSVRDIISIEQQFDDININKRTFGEAYLTDSHIIFYWTKTLSFISQFLNKHPDDPVTAGSITSLERIAASMAALEELLLKDASSGILDTDVLASIGERWSRLDRMAESYGDSVASLRSLKRWCVVPRIRLCRMELTADREDVAREIKTLSVENSASANNRTPSPVSWVRRSMTSP